MICPVMNETCKMLWRKQISEKIRSSLLASGDRQQSSEALADSGQLEKEHCVGRVKLLSCGEAIDCADISRQLLAVSAVSEVMSPGRFVPCYGTCSCQETARLQTLLLQWCQTEVWKHCINHPRAFIALWIIAVTFVTYTGLFSYTEFNPQENFILVYVLKIHKPHLN